MSKFGTFIKKGYNKVIDYVWQEVPRVISPNRNRVMPYPEEHVSYSSTARAAHAGTL